MLRRVRSAAFTLIELLIVVAIIAILAAIAVPNFLEAQVRSKVSRVKADLRSLAVAQEAYSVDWNSYTASDHADDPVYMRGWRQLTSPVAYITMIPNDAFGSYRFTRGTANDPRLPLLELGTGVAGVANSGQWPPTPDKIGQLNPNGFPSNTYFMTSAGPDHFDDTNFNVMGFSLTEQDFPWPNLPNNEQAVMAILTLCYDPTNGTVSGGQIYRTGGTKLPGRPGDALWANSSGAK